MPCAACRRSGARTCPPSLSILSRAGQLTNFQVHKLQQGITLGLVLGPYRILVPLGRGGMGTVYLAIDTRNGRHVALKILPPKVARTEERLLAAFSAKWSCRKRSTIRTWPARSEVGVFQGIHFIAMEFIPGADALPRRRRRMALCSAAHRPSVRRDWRRPFRTPIRKASSTAT